ncbi:MAG TPA: hypothetical protein PLF81_30130 [Candidatus Anammoximicrobium sp.]|nr:hypothetical protein [Candidatus Anammoximicrobium sp.]
MRLMWTDSERESIFRAIDSLEGAPDANPAARWVYGVVFPTLGLFLAVYVSIRGTLGAACLVAAFALLAHSHWFWSPSEKWCAVGYIGKVVALLAIVATIFSFLWWFLMRS